MSTESNIDKWAKASIEREERRPRWQKLVGNFGFAFIFIGALLNCALFVILVALEIDSPYLYKPWWLTYIVLCIIAGWRWRLHGRLMAAA
jgi:hypothetical protein